MAVQDLNVTAAQTINLATVTISNNAYLPKRDTYVFVLCNWHNVAFCM